VVAALRVLGKSETPNVEWASMVLVTANNFEISGDTVRRIILCRLEPKVERPETRTQFKYNDLLFYVKTHRPRILRHLLTILLAPRGQVEIGRMGSFEKWVELIGGAIFSVSGIDITKLPTQTEILNRDVRRSRLAVLLALIEALQIRDNRALPQEFTSQELIDSCSVSAPPEWRELFSPNEVSVRSIGRLLSSVCGRVLDGKRLVRRTARGKTVWSVERVNS
jgi:putative DNA primase/helicase